MNRPRVVLATKSYWPHVSESGRACERLALALSTCGAAVQVVTAEFGQAPQGMYWDGEIPVVRLPHGPNSWWGPMRYWFALADWLKSQRDTYDLVCVSGLQYDAYSASQALAAEPQPLVLRAEAAGLLGDCHWQATARFGGRVKHRCQQAHAIVAVTDTIAAELIEAGYDPAQITTIENGLPVEPFPPPSTALRQAARGTLAEAHASLRVPLPARIALCLEPIANSEQLPPLLAFWQQVVALLPTAQLWLIGQGRTYDIVPRLAERQGLELSIAAPGMFDDLTELYQAADLLLVPFDTAGQSLSALEAMASRLPVVAADTPGNRRLLAGGELGSLIDIHQQQAAGQMTALLAEPAPLAAATQRAYETISRQHRLQQMGQQHLTLFKRLLDARPLPITA